MTKVKMAFKLAKDEDGYPPDDFETMWVEDLGEYNYRIDNIPFYVEDLSPDDIVKGEIINNILYFSKILKKSNISVIRIVFFSNNQKDKDRLLQKLVDSGCRWEGSHLSKLYSVEIPKSANADAAKAALDIEMANGVLDYEEASIRR